MRYFVVYMDTQQVVDVLERASDPGLKILLRDKSPTVGMRFYIDRKGRIFPSGLIQNAAEHGDRKETALSVTIARALITHQDARALRQEARSWYARIDAGRDAREVAYRAMCEREQATITGREVYPDSSNSSGHAEKPGIDSVLSNP